MPKDSVLGADGDRLLLSDGSRPMLSCRVYACVGNSEKDLLTPSVSQNEVSLADSHGRILAVVTLVDADDETALRVEKCIDENFGIEAVGRINLAGGMPCLMEDGGGSSDYFIMTSGVPVSPVFDCVYSPVEDTAVTMRSGTRRFVAGEKAVDFCLFDDRVISFTISRDHYRRNVNAYYRPMDRQIFDRPPVGWLSWYCYFGDFNEEKALKTLDFADREFKRYGFEYIQLENWQKYSLRLPVCNYFHSLECDPMKFPHGMKYIAEKIRERGLKPGLWVVLFGTGEEEHFQKHREMYLTYENGEPIPSWSGNYSLDPTHPEAKRTMSEMLRTLVHDWGYEYVKVDGLEIGGDDANGSYADTCYAKEAVKSRFHSQETDPLRNIVLLIREAVGDKTFITACGGNRGKGGKCVGIANAARTGTDLFWEDEDPAWSSVVSAARVIQSAHHVHNVFWYNDPDVLSLRPPLNEKQAQMLSTLYGVSGQLLFLGDILYELSPERVDMLKRLMPVENVFPGHIPAHTPMDASKCGGSPWGCGDLRDVWVLHIRKDFEQWQVAALFNWTENDEKRIKFDADKAGLRSDGSYLVYDYWNDTFLGRLRGECEFVVPSQSCLLLSVREESSHPQIVSVNRHITQCGVSLQDVKWDEKNNVLVGSSEVVGNDEYVLTVHLPEGFGFQSLTTDAGEAVCRQVAENILKIIIRSQENVLVRWSIAFMTGVERSSQWDPTDSKRCLKQPLQTA